MVANRIISFFMKYKKSILGFAFALLSTTSVSFGNSFILSSKTDIGSQMTNIIRLNNRLNDERQTYWRCEPVESRRDWLGWGVKSYLTSLANPWATYGDIKNNNCFLYTDASKGQTFIRNQSNNELIPVSVFSSPSSRSLSCFDIQLESGGEVNTKYDFYCSKSLADTLNWNLDNQSLVVDCGGEEASNISFNGVVKTFGYDFINKFVGDNKNYIIVPYILHTEEKDEIISYDMQKYTGQSSFYALLKNDRYENNYYSLMINSIYQMGGVKDQLCYKATFIDSFDGLKTSYEEINSSVQSDYLKTIESFSGNVAHIVIGIVLIIVGATGIILLLFKLNKKIYQINTLNMFFASSASLIIFWLFGEILYKVDVSKMLFWDIGSRIISFVLVAVISAVTVAIARYLSKNSFKEISNIEYNSIDI